MKKFLLITIATLAVLASGGCKEVDRICDIERKAHIKYVTYVAPFRPADRVALEQINYNNIEAACLTRDPFGVLFSLIRAGASLRS